MNIQFNSKTKYMVTNRFIKYILYSLSISLICITGYIILDKLVLLNAADTKNLLLIINLLLCILILGLNIFILIKIKSLKNNYIMQKFMKTDGYINLIYTLVYTFIGVCGAVITASISAAFDGLDYLFIWLLMFYISMTLFIAKRMINIILIIINRTQVINSKFFTSK